MFNSESWRGNQDGWCYYSALSGIGKGSSGAAAGFGWGAGGLSGLRDTGLRDREGCSVPESAERSVVSVGRRIGLWFVSLLVAAALFSVLLTLWLMMAGSARPALAVAIFRVTMMCALPVWCLCLPVVIAVKDTTGWRTILLSGSLIGPLLIGLWFLVLQIGGASPQTMWQGDPLIGWVGSAIAGMIFAFIVGLLTSSLYLVGFKSLHRRSEAGFRSSGGN